MTDNVLRNPLVLPEDLLIIPVADLPDEVRGKLGDGGEEFAITRPRARTPSKLIDAAAASLIEQFRQPRTIVQAVIAYSRKHGADPTLTLEDSLPLLRQLLGSGLLLPEGAEQVQRIQASFASGAMVGSFRIRRCIQVLEDSEIYQARDPDGAFVALKIARSDHIDTMQGRIDREAAVLAHLAGTKTPQLVGRGAVEERPFLAMQWVSGIDAVSVADDLREHGTRRDLLELFLDIARAYSSLHQRGVLHGDVHPGNLLVGRDETVTVIDFGLAQVVALALAPVGRGGVGLFMEPEYASAVLERRSPPAPTAAGEQFAVAALLYMLATGRHYMEFTLQQEEMFQQIRDAAPLSFSDRGVGPWPALERVLRRALAVAPAARYEDMSKFADALAAVTAPTDMASSRSYEGSGHLLNAMLEYVGLDGALYRDGLPQGPLCSVNFGAAGIAYALCRLASRRDDPRLLAMADAWITKAESHVTHEAAFSNAEMEMTAATLGRVSPYHAPPGLHLVHAMIAEANGEGVVRDAAATAFLSGIDLPCLERDLTLGRCGTVLGGAMLLEILPDAKDPLWDQVRRAGEDRLNELWLETAGFDPLDGGRQWPNVGIAHGWAGLLYATLRWHALTGAVLPPAFHDRLSQLIAVARPTGRGATWPWRQHATDDGLATMSGWCNGSAGIVHLACLAHRLLSDDSLLDVAEAAAWHAWEAGEGPVDLCCGYAGRAYALIEMYRSTGELKWLQRARVLVGRAVQAAPQMRTEDHPRHSLYKGELGLVVLIDDLEQASSAAMPMFAPEGWR